jgi:tetratricopeptide (TPR) repeat protein
LLSNVKSCLHEIFFAVIAEEFTIKDHQETVPNSAHGSVDWEKRLANLWLLLDEYLPEKFIESMTALTAELPSASPVAMFELAAAYDSTGSPGQAVRLYESALAAGLSGIRRRRVNIQMASSLRNLGHAQQAVDMLLQESKQPSDELDQAVSAFLALALADLGREREALSISLEALSAYLPRYNRSLSRYAKALVSDNEN